MLQIEDCEKNLVKLKGGEYVAVEDMESCLRGLPIFMIANGDLDSLLDVACTNSEALFK